MSRRDDILAFVTAYIDEHGWAPSYREIMDKTGTPSTATVQRHLFELERQGKLRLGGGGRMIALPKDADA